MVEPEEPALQFHAARFRRFARPLSGATATDLGTAASSIPATGIQFLMPDTEASISEEPGAGIRHAGICAGAVWATGRPTAMAHTHENRLPSVPTRSSSQSFGGQ